MSEAPELEDVKKQQVPRNDQFLFTLHKKNEFFKLTKGYPPRPVCRKTIKDPTLQQKPMKIGCLPQNMDESSPGFHDMNALEICSDCRKK